MNRFNPAAIDDLVKHTVDAGADADTDIGGNREREASKPAELWTQARLVRLQALSAALFSLFLIPHLLNTLLAAFGPAVYNDFQQLIRPVYQWPVIEIGLIAVPLAIHIVVAGVLFRRRLRTGRSLPKRQRLHQLAGVFLLLMIVGHVGATRGVELLSGVASGFEGIAFTFWWMPGYFYPYYFLFFMAGFYHVFNGISLMLARQGYPWLYQAKGMRYSIMLLVMTVLSCSLLTFGGVMTRGVIDNAGIDDRVMKPYQTPYARAYTEVMGLDIPEVRAFHANSAPLQEGTIRQKASALGH